jgi:hypothetical protein
MSRGPGHIERAIEQALRDTDRSFIVEELAKLAYPDIAAVEKKHRVAVLRAISNVEKKIPLWFFRTYTPPWRLIMTNRNNVRSYAHGFLRYSWWNAERTLDEIENILRDPEIQLVMEPGGIWWTNVEINKAESESRSFWKSLATKGHWDIWSCREFWNSDSDAPPELREKCDLEFYRNSLAGSSYLHVLLGKFEPPGTAVFKYAMEHRAGMA